jgi:hypothetical protein
MAAKDEAQRLMAGVIATFKNNAIGIVDRR